MKNMLLVLMLAASTAAAQTTVRAPIAGINAIPGLGASFDGAAPGSTPMPALTMLMPILAPTLVQPALNAAILAAAAKPVEGAALASQGSNEFSQAPAWFDASRLTFDAIVKSGTGATAVLRYGWRSQFEMSVFAFPGGASISFKEYSTDPMGRPKRSFDAALETAAARKAAANILRAAQARHPVSGKDKAALDEILAFLEGN